MDGVFVKRKMEDSVMAMFYVFWDDARRLLPLGLRPR